MSYLSRDSLMMVMMLFSYFQYAPVASDMFERKCHELPYVSISLATEDRSYATRQNLYHASTEPLSPMT
jgi:hypothetical protein